MRLKNTDALPLVEQGETPNPLGNAMRDRLIELLEAVYKNPKVRCPRSDELTCDGCKYDLGDHCDISAIIADHLLESGVIVPPCKVGDTVYVVSQGAGFSVVWNVYKATAKAIHLDQWGTLFVRVETDKENVGGYVEVGRVFLTREEAEAALAERSEG